MRLGLSYLAIGALCLGLAAGCGSDDKKTDAGTTPGSTGGSGGTGGSKATGGTGGGGSGSTGGTGGSGSGSTGGTGGSGSGSTGGSGGSSSGNKDAGTSSTGGSSGTGGSGGSTGGAGGSSSGNKDAGTTGGTGGAGGAGGTMAAVSWEKDIKPIFAKKCTPCHTGGGSGGHNLGSTYADAMKAAANAKCTGKTKAECTIVRIKAGDMPLLQGCKNDGTDTKDACLTKDETAKVQAWVDAKTPM